MKTELARSDFFNSEFLHHFSVSDYHRLGEAGILKEDDRVELIGGRIVDMTPIGSRHAACVKRLIDIISRQLQFRAILSVQDPILLDDSEPEPDLSLLKKRADFYSEQHPKPEDVLLIIEIADSSLAYDRDVKIPLYARALIQEVWLLDLIDNVVYVYSSPSSDGYHVTTRLDRTQTLSPLCFSDMNIMVGDVLGLH